MADATKIITFAYYLMGKKNPEQDTALTAQQLSLGLDALNFIIADLRNKDWFNNQLAIISTTAGTRYIYIGETVTTAETNVTIITAPYFSIISAASTQIAQTFFPMNIHNLATLYTTNFTESTGRPNAIYVQNEVDESNNFFTKIYVNPRNNAYTLTFIGVPGQSDSGETTTLMNGFEKYLTYQIGQYLSSIYNRMEQWNSQNEAMRQQTEMGIKELFSPALEPEGTRKVMSGGDIFNPLISR